METQEKIAAFLNSGAMLARGTISAHGRTKSGKRSHILQYHRKAKHYSRNVSHDELPRFETAVANCREFMELVQRFVDEQTARTIRMIEKEVGHDRRKTAAAGRKDG